MGRSCCTPVFTSLVSHEPVTHFSAWSSSLPPPPGRTAGAPVPQEGTSSGERVEKIRCHILDEIWAVCVHLPLASTNMKRQVDEEISSTDATLVKGGPNACASSPGGRLSSVAPGGAEGKERPSRLGAKPSSSSSLFHGAGRGGCCRAEPFPLSEGGPGLLFPINDPH